MLRDDTYIAPNDGRLGDISKTIKNQIAEFMPVMPLVAALRNPGMRERHWEGLAEKTGKPLQQAEPRRSNSVDMSCGSSADARASRHAARPLLRCVNATALPGHFTSTRCCLTSARD